MKTKITKTKFAKDLKQRIKEHREWYYEVACMDISEEAKRLFFQGQAQSLLDAINTIANKILKNYK